jgi:hypothetical protein
VPASKDALDERLRRELGLSGLAKDALTAAALQRLAYGQFQRRYRMDPAGFVDECIEFPKDEYPASYQLQTLEDLIVHKRVAIRGPHGLGKTAVPAWAVLWFGLTRDGDDWKVPTTASVWRQLTEFLWPEIHKWARLIKWDIVGRDPLRIGPRGELQKLHLVLQTGQAFGVASDQSSAIEGAHADHMLYVYDEAKAIPDDTFDASEGAFFGAGEGTNREAFALAQSTPGAPQGRFHAIHSHRPGLEHWKTKHVTVDMAIKAGRIARDVPERMARQWGKKSVLYQQRVLGNFATDVDALIPLEWVEAANERWLALEQDTDGLPKVDRRKRRYIGADIADTGGDENVIAYRYGLVLRELEFWQGADLMETTGFLVQAHREASDAPLVVDVIGIGSGVVARLNELGIPTLPFHASEASGFSDRTGRLVFGNKRAAAWWNLRELLQPENNHNIALPPDELLTSDLTTPKMRVGSRGAIYIEEKVEIRKRLGRSTDRGDGVVEAFYGEILELELNEGPEGFVEYESRVEISPV